MTTPDWNEKQAVMRAFDPTLDAHRVTLIAGNGQAYEKFTFTIPASTTLVVDTNLLSSFTRLEYILNFKDSPLTVSKSLKLIGLWNGSDLSDTVSERQGGPINVIVSLTEDSVDAFLSVQNNELYSLTLTLLKSKI